VPSKRRDRPLSYVVSLSRNPEYIIHALIFLERFCDHINIRTEKMKQKNVSKDTVLITVYGSECMFILISFYVRRPTTVLVQFPFSQPSRTRSVLLITRAGKLSLLFQGLKSSLRVKSRGDFIMQRMLVKFLGIICLCLPSSGM
jgi:hypothetical protein